MILFLLTKQQSPLLNDNVTKIYQNAPPRLGASINLGTKSHLTSLELGIEANTSGGHLLS